MIFYLLRIIFLVFILVVVYMFCRSAAKCSKKTSVILGAVFSLVITAGISMFPVENMVIDFSSPESAFKYSCSGKIEKIIYGSDSCLVVYSDGHGTFKDCVFLKSEVGYKLPSYFSRSKAAHVFTQNGLFNTYRVNGTGDYYVQGSVPNAEVEEIAVFDGAGSRIDTDIFRIDHTGFIYFHLSCFQDDYYLVVSGKTQPLS